ncbi:BQ2448_3665 [Microbotryum intermedium]|uniref:BQ2448_3665 protein n=1 Tax=Microbotryum intermedium TaxID=269621 RepID=A0A238FFW4_9BASI|nr:BQ2448_3665 [Microbotryum intermedium]
MTGLLSATALFFNHHRDQQKSTTMAMIGLSRPSPRLSRAGTAGKSTCSSVATVSAKQLRSEFMQAFHVGIRHALHIDLKSLTHFSTALQTSWKHRLMALTLRQRELEYVESCGSTICWAGSVRDLPSLRSARVEAEFVVRQLLSAIAELKDHRKSSARSAKVYPSALANLPYPVPQPPKESSYDAITERPPQLQADEHGSTAPAYDLTVIEQDPLIAFTPLQEGVSAEEDTKTVWATSYVGF